MPYYFIVFKNGIPESFGTAYCKRAILEKKELLECLSNDIEVRLVDVDEYRRYRNMILMEGEKKRALMKSLKVQRRDLNVCRS
ncbi:hypothetical protein ACO3VM_02840 [Methanocaldococcus sp. 10A]